MDKTSKDKNPQGTSAIYVAIACVVAVIAVILFFELRPVFNAAPAPTPTAETTEEPTPTPTPSPTPEEKSNEERFLEARDDMHDYVGAGEILLEAKTQPLKNLWVKEYEAECQPAEPVVKDTEGHTLDSLTFGAASTVYICPGQEGDVLVIGEREYSEPYRVDVRPEGDKQIEKIEVNVSVHSKYGPQFTFPEEFPFRFIYDATYVSPVTATRDGNEVTLTQDFNDPILYTMSFTGWDGSNKNENEEKYSKPFTLECGRTVIESWAKKRDTNKESQRERYVFDQIPLCSGTKVSDIGLLTSLGTVISEDGKLVLVSKTEEPKANETVLFDGEQCELCCLHETEKKGTELLFVSEGMIYRGDIASPDEVTKAFSLPTEKHGNARAAITVKEMLCVGDILFLMTPQRVYLVDLKTNGMSIPLDDPYTCMAAYNRKLCLGTETGKIIIYTVQKDGTLEKENTVEISGKPSIDALAGGDKLYALADGKVYEVAGKNAKPSEDSHSYEYLCFVDDRLLLRDMQGQWYAKKNGKQCEELAAPQGIAAAYEGFFMLRDSVKEFKPYS